MRPVRGCCERCPQRRLDLLEFIAISRNVDADELALFKKMRAVFGR